MIINHNRGAFAGRRRPNSRVGLGERTEDVIRGFEFHRLAWGIPLPSLLLTPILYTAQSFLGLRLNLYPLILQDCQAVNLRRYSALKDMVSEQALFFQPKFLRRLTTDMLEAKTSQHNLLNFNLSNT
jgi:hypothetical protein